MNSIGAVGAIAGGLMAIGTDPIIIFYAIIIGAGLVVHQSRFSILYFMLAAVVGAAAVHYFLGTTKLIVDIIRVDVLLIIPALIVIITSFFTPKSKAIKTELIKVEPSILKMMRILILIFGAAISGFLLFVDPRGYNYLVSDTLFGKYVTENLMAPFPLWGNYENTMLFVHIILFIISMVAIFKLRFCIVHVLLTRTRYPEKKGTSSIIKSINKFFKSI